MMTDFFHKTIALSASIPINIWFWLALATAPVSVFYIKTGESNRRNVFKWLLTVGLTYVFINLSLHTHRAIKRATHEACQSSYADGAIQGHPECGTVNIADGASNIFYLYAGWLPAILYVGLWIMIYKMARARNPRSQQSH